MDLTWRDLGHGPSSGITWKELPQPVSSATLRSTHRQPACDPWLSGHRGQGTCSRS